MKKYIIITLLLLGFIQVTNAQKNINLGAGYFGHFGTHPGMVLELESEYIFSETASLPLRIDLGYYRHPRNHDGIFMDINYGYRKYLRSGIFLEESVGVGVLQSVLNSDGVFKIDDSGNMQESSRAVTLDLLPSITLGLGYDLSKKGTNRDLIWVRPKIAWQIPHKTSSLYHVSLQIGYTHTIK